MSVAVVSHFSYRELYNHCYWMTTAMNRIGQPVTYTVKVRYVRKNLCQCGAPALENVKLGSSFEIKPLETIGGTWTCWKCGRQDHLLLVPISVNDEMILVPTRLLSLNDLPA